jgi:hypothetical protein
MVLNDLADGSGAGGNRIKAIRFPRPNIARCTTPGVTRLAMAMGSRLLLVVIEWLLATITILGVLSDNLLLPIMSFR